MKFDIATDDESVQLQHLRATSSPEDIASTVCGIDASHPLHTELVAAIRRANN